MSRKKEEQTLAVGATPKADLLPVAVKEAIRRRPVVRRLIFLVAVILILTLVGVAGATYLAVSSQQALANEQARSQQLLAQQLEFAEARTVAGQVDESIAAQRAATQTEIDWNALVGEIRQTLPAGLVLNSVGGQTQTVGQDEEAPLRQDSVATFRITANSPTVPDVETWLANLESVPGFAGIAPPVSVTGGEAATYTVTLEFLVDESVFLQRFAPADDSGDDAADETDGEG